MVWPMLFCWMRAAIESRHHWAQRDWGDRATLRCKDVTSSSPQRRHRAHCEPDASAYVLHLATRSDRPYAYWRRQLHHDRLISHLAPRSAPEGRHQGSYGAWIGARAVIRMGSPSPECHRLDQCLREQGCPGLCPRAGPGDWFGRTGESREAEVILRSPSIRSRRADDPSRVLVRSTLCRSKS